MNDYVNDDYDKQILHLTKQVAILREKLFEAEQELKVKDKIPIPRTVVTQIVQMEAVIRKQKSDLEYYKKYVPVHIIINKEQKEKPARRGGVPK